MGKPTYDRWDEIDAFIVADRMIPAIRAYRAMSGGGLNDAVEGVYDRKAHLLATCPERFKSDAEYQAEAYARLRALASPVVVIEGYWDGDSEGWRIELTAITAQPSSRHARYTDSWLYAVRGLERQVERAIEFGTELAQSVGVGFYLTDTNTLDIDDEKRWWDEPRVGQA